MSQERSCHKKGHKKKGHKKKGNKKKGNKKSRLEAKAIKVALYHQWLKTTDDNGNAISCSQEMADATYKMLSLFDKLIKESDKDN